MTRLLQMELKIAVAVAKASRTKNVFTFILFGQGKDVREVSRVQDAVRTRIMWQMFCRGLSCASSCTAFVSLSTLIKKLNREWTDRCNNWLIIWLQVKDLARFKPMQRHLFLYDKMLLFCKKREETTDGHEKTPSYSFKHSLKVRCSLCCVRLFFLHLSLLSCMCDHMMFGKVI